MDNILPAIVTGIFTIIAIWFKDVLKRKKLSKIDAKAEEDKESVDYAGETIFALVQILISGVFYYIFIAIFGDGSITFFRAIFIVWCIFIVYAAWSDEAEPHRFAAILIGCFTIYLVWLFRLDLVDAYHGLTAFLRFGKN